MIEPYRPSNASEGMAFTATWCDRCAAHGANGCPIETATMLFPVDHPEYPKEWREDGASGPRCTAFEPISIDDQPLDPCGCGEAPAMTKKPTEPPVSRAANRLAKREVDYGLDDRLIPIDAVIQIAGIGKTMIYRLMREGKFPKSCNVGGASVRWSEKEVKAWRDKVLAERDAA